MSGKVEAGQDPELSAVLALAGSGDFAAAAEAASILLSGPGGASPERTMLAAWAPIWRAAADAGFQPPASPQCADTEPLFLRALSARLRGPTDLALTNAWVYLAHSPPTGLQCQRALAEVANAAAAARDVPLATHAVQTLLAQTKMVSVAMAHEAFARSIPGVLDPRSSLFASAVGDGPLSLPEPEAAGAMLAASSAACWAAVLELHIDRWRLRGVPPAHTTGWLEGQRRAALSALSAHYERGGDADNLARIRALQAEAEKEGSGGADHNRGEEQSPPEQEDASG